MRTQQWIVSVLAVGVMSGVAGAAPGLVGGYAADYSLQTIATGTDLYHVDQLAFNPADPTHLYAARVVFGAAQQGTIVRFDYNVNPSTGATTISNPLVVATLETGWGPIGMGFWQGNMIVSVSHNGNGTDAVGAYGNDGRLAILKPNLDGTFGGRVDFAYGMFNDYHQIDQLRIIGNTLYVGIGKRDNNGNASANAVYNGTIGRIADLSLTNFVDGDHNGFADTNALAGNYATSANDGMLRMYASGFRNPFGLTIAPDGKLWVTDNGRDDNNGDPVTPDLLYKELPLGATGIFPPGNGGITSPLATLGNSTAATGLAILPFVDVGDALVGRYRNSPGQGGADYVLVDSVTGQVNVFADGFSHPLDAIVDPYGRVLLADFDIGGGSGGLYVLAPEPASLAMLAVGGIALLGRRSRAPK